MSKTKMNRGRAAATRGVTPLPVTTASSAKATRTATMRWLTLAAVCVTGVGASAYAIRQHSGPHAQASGASTLASVPSATPGASGSAAPPSAAVPAVPAQFAADAQVAKWEAEVKAKPNDAVPELHLGDALMQKARETADISYYSLAENRYKKAIALDPKRYDAYTGLAWVTSGRHEFEQSIQWANKALAIDPIDNDAYGLLGDADVEMGNYDAAYDHYQKMLDIRPDLASYSRGAHLLFLMGDTRKALYVMNEAVKTGGPFAENTAWCRAQIATMLWANGAIDGAEQVAADGLSKSPHNYHLQLIEGKIKSSQKEYPAAIAAYRQAIEVAPQHEALVLLGDLYHLTGDEAEAKKQYDLVETVYRMNKSRGMTGDWALAKFYADHDRNLPEALKMAQNEFKTRPNVAVADALAWCYYKNGDYREAAHYSDLARAHNTPDASYIFHAGMIAAKLGDSARAQTLLSKAMNLTPNFNPLDVRLAETTFGTKSSRLSVAQLTGPAANKGTH